MINLQKLYLNWLIGLIEDEGHSNYRLLCEHLMTIEFRWSVRMDENRAADGIYLRSVYENQTGYSMEEDMNAPCTVLEMMVALAQRGGEDILWDGENNWTPYIFWTMISNLDLLMYTDTYFWNSEWKCVTEIDERIDIFLDRKYDKNGRGGLFLPVPNLSQIPKKFQKMEIWYQMAAWLTDNFV